MKKSLATLLVTAMVSVLLALPVSAYGNDTTGNGNTYNTTGNYSTNTTGYSTNNVRARATTTGTSSNWGWLGLIGLLGLAGMRRRESDRS
ncbi:WGxxGxxG family protein [Paenibacillus sp. M1]|uniref:WGxxGxxG family protein n=1 Tax=Paenibacillus haidiansis TaxID=1574488 RepID=A0ABU7VLM8_9BACL